jgi:hypothetical protein
MLLETINQPFNQVSTTVQLSLEGTLPIHVLPFGNRKSDASFSQVRSYRLTAISFVAYDSLRLLFGTASARPLNRSSGHQSRNLFRFVCLSRGEDKRHWFALSLCSQVDFGAKPTSTSS